MADESNVAVAPANQNQMTGHMQSLAPPEGRQSGPSLTEIMQAMPDTENRDAYLKSLIDIEAERQQFRQDWQLAYQLAMSGEFADMKNKNERQAIATAITKVQLGRAWGLSPYDSMRYVFFTNGKPGVENSIVASKMKESGLDWDIEFDEVEEDHKGKPWKRCTGCTLYLKVWSEKHKAYIPVLDRKGNQVSYGFTEADADHAIIHENGKQIPLSQKWNFKSWPRDMYYWRAVARVHKFHAPNVMRGAVPQAELWDVPLEQEVIDATPAAGMLPEPPEPPETPAKRPLRDIVMDQVKKIDEKP